MQVGIISGKPRAITRVGMRMSGETEQRQRLQEAHLIIGRLDQIQRERGELEAESSLLRARLARLLREFGTGQLAVPVHQALQLTKNSGPLVLISGGKEFQQVRNDLQGRS